MPALIILLLHFEGQRLGGLIIHMNVQVTACHSKQGAVRVEVHAVQVV